MLIFIISALILSNIYFFLIFKKNQTQKIVFDAEIANLKQDLNLKNIKLDALQLDNNELRNLKGVFEGNLAGAKNEINNLNSERSKMLTQIDVLNNRIIEFEKQKERINQNLRHLEEEKLEWQKNKETILLQLSEELIKKNHEQQAKLTAANNEQVSQITHTLLKNFENVFAKMQNLDEEVKKSSLIIS